MDTRTISQNTCFKLSAAALSLLAATQAYAFDDNNVRCDGPTVTDRCTITIAPAGGAGMVLATERGNIQPTLDGSGYTVIGDTHIVSPAGEFPMLDADLVIEYEDASSPYLGLRRLRGTAEIPFPQPSTNGGGTGIGGDIGLYTNARAAIGLDLGSNLEHLGAHLNPERECMGRTSNDPAFQECPYLFFHVEAGSDLAGTLGSEELQWSMGASVGTSASATFVLDPYDFYFYLGASYQPFDAINLTINPSSDKEGFDGEDKGFGFSRSGWIPYLPQTSYGIEDYVALDEPQFHGHLVINGLEAVIPGTPIGVEGYAIYRFPVDLSGNIEFSPEFDVGFNGDMAIDVSRYFPFLEHRSTRTQKTTTTDSNGQETSTSETRTTSTGVDLSQLFSLSLPLGTATLGGHIAEGEQFMYFSGVAAVDAMDWLPGILPLRANADAMVYGAFMNRSEADSALPYVNVSDSFMAIEAMYELDLTLGGKHNGFYGNRSAYGTLRASASDGVYARLTLSDELGATALHPMISLGTSTTVEYQANPFDPMDSFYRIRGDLGVGGATLGTNAELIISPQEAFVGIGINLDGTAIGEAIDDANRDIETARADVNRLDILIAENRAIVQAEHDATQAELENAKADITAAQNQVNSLQSQIDDQYSRINTRKAEISSWYRWYKRQPWYKKSWAWAKYVYQRGWRSSEIAGRYATIATLKTAKAIAVTSLEVAKQTLAGAQAVVNLPVDLDPRVAPLIASREVANATLQATLDALALVPEMPGRIEAMAGARINGDGLEGLVRGEFCDARGCIAFEGGSVNFDTRTACAEIPGVYEIPVCTKF